MFRRMKEERGIAAVTAILASVVVLSLGLTVVSLSIHNATGSSNDRKRVQAIDAAEAGVNAAFYTISVSTTTALPCTLDADLPTAPTAHYHVTVDYYATYPPSGDPMACPPPGAPADPPEGAAIVSTGTAVLVGTPTAVSRTMESSVRLAPVFKPYGQAIFANQNLSMQNNLDVIGNSGNDGDVYTNGSWVCNNGSYIRGSVIAQGSVTMSNSCTVAQDIQAKNAVNMSQQSRVNHDVTSSNQSITMLNNSKIVNNATAGTTCTGCTTGTGGRVGGTVTTNHISPPPQVRPFPVLNFVQSDWEKAGFTVQSYAECVTPQPFINDTGSATKYVVRVSPTCPMLWGNNSSIKVREDLAIITDGSITTMNQTTWASADGNKHTIYFIVPYSAASSCTGGVHDINMSNNTSFTNLYILMYTPCTITLQNNNFGQGGQIFGQNVNITNLYSLVFKPILIPGAGDVSGFTLDIAYLREVQNP